MSAGAKAIVDAIQGLAVVVAIWGFILLLNFLPLGWLILAAIRERKP